MGCKGVFVVRTCFRDGVEIAFDKINTFQETKNLQVNIDIFDKIIDVYEIIIIFSIPSVHST